MLWTAAASKRTMQVVDEIQRISLPIWVLPVLDVVKVSSSLA